MNSPQQKPERRLTYKEKAQQGLLPRKTRQADMKRGKGLDAVSKAPRNRSRALRYKCGVAAIREAQPALASLDAHHPYGRLGDNLFKVTFISRTLHDWIHGHPNEAYALGWLTPEYRGLTPNTNHPQPWTTLHQL